jgi:hypothetical protein
VSFEITFPTRHTDAFAATGYVHAGVLLALTEMRTPPSMPRVMA